MSLLQKKSAHDQGESRRADFYDTLRLQARHAFLIPPCGTKKIWRAMEKEVKKKIK